jgi:hypothetical protein
LSGLSGERWYGIYYHHGNNGLIEGNNIYNNPGGGLQLYPGPTSGLRVRNNRIHDNNTLTASPVGGIIVANEVMGTEISNNLIYRNGSAAVHGPSPGIEVQYGPKDTKIWNNTVYGNAGEGILISTADATNSVVQNNVVYGNARTQIHNVGAGTVIDHNLTSNPSFVNPAASDFNLQSGSLAIDAGVTLSNVTVDFNKRSRPQGLTYDIGAYEVGSSSAPLPPRNLSVR